MVDSAGSRLKVFDVNDENQSNSTPSCIRIGSETAIVAFVSNKAVFVNIKFQVVELSEESVNVIVVISLVTLTPGTLTMISS